VMPKYRVYGVVTGSKYLGEFIADTPEDAVAEAMGAGHVSLCHHCDSECEDAAIESAIAEPVDE
jgi:hypothetical protein